MNLLELFRKAPQKDRAELAADLAPELKVALEALPTTPKPVRVVLTPAEKKALGEEIDRLREAATASTAALEARRIQVEEAVKAAMAAHDEFLRTRETANEEYVAARDRAKARAWEMRSPLVDALRAKVLAEVQELREQSFTIPGEDIANESIRGGGGGIGILLTPAVAEERAARFSNRTLTNGRSVEVRQHALRSLASGLENLLTVLLMDDDELQQWFDREYAALPQVESLRAILSRDPKGKVFAHRFAA